MASPSISSTVNFVKKYPITLCGLSLFFMPSVHRLLLYFTPLLLSTAIFIVAMLSWGPSMPSAETRKRRGRPNDWAFNGSLKIYEEEEEEEEEDEEEEVKEATEAPQSKLSEGIDLQQEAISSKGNESKKLEPDPDFDEESNRVATASNDAISGRGQAEPDPDLRGDCVGTASNGAIPGSQAEPDPDLIGDCVGTASNGAISCGQADPDLHGDACSAGPDLGGHRGPVLNAVADHHREPADPDVHGERNVDDQDFPTAKHLHSAPDHHHLSASHDNHINHAEPAPINHYQQAAGDHLHYYDAEPHHLNYHDADRLNHVDYHAEPDPDLHGEAAVHAKSEGPDLAHAAAIAELRQKLGMMKRTPYSDDARDMHSQQLAERLQTLQAAA